MTAALSGFCNPSNPPDSHDRCRKADCPCEHHETATVTQLQPVPAAPVDPVDSLQTAVQAMESGLAGLVAAADDPQGLGLARLLYDVRAARTQLYALEQDLEGITAKALMADELQGEGVRVERYRSRDRKEWDHDAWKRDVRAKALRKHGALRAAAVVTADGEELAVNLQELLAEVQGVHGATAPKTTTLRALGLDVADYCKTDPGTAHVRVLLLADETEGEGE